MIKKEAPIKTKILFTISTFIFTSLFIFGCLESVKLPPIDNSFSVEDGNFTLYVSNQNFKISKVDIQIKIDGKVVVSRYFKVGNQHNWKKFVFSLPKGDHILEAHSDQEDVTFTETFNISDKHWAVVAFWCYPETQNEQNPKRFFTFKIRNEPIYFE
ncbi:MAG: hypothetical protein JW787_04130 [Sedimentisphaerales bacterium]|nr:hypothetical protein [Sedimentisphaerales bacterium]